MESIASWVPEPYRTTDLGLGERQELQALGLQRLLAKMHREGYAVRLGHAHRTDPSYRRLLHWHKCAVDLHLFRDGEYLTRTEDHERFGAWWERQHPLFRWGGRFGDGNHYSTTYRGMA